MLIICGDCSELGQPFVTRFFKCWWTECPNPLHQVDHTMAKKSVKVCSDSLKLAGELCELLKSSYLNCKDKVFTVGLSGGSLVGMLCKILPLLNNQVDWSKWRFFFCDERMVPFGDGESTFGAYWKAIESLEERLPLTKEQFVSINASLDGQDCAQDYRDKIEKCAVVDRTNGLPRFHILLLGMGPDGHTASLFPGHPLLEVREVENREK